MKKVIIVDDEAPARSLIREFLEDFEELIVIGESNNGVDALKLIEEFNPDLVFLDVQMPGMTGFQVLEHLQRVPQIIFSTAYDKYALEAFEVNAVDYLLKPYTKERFGRAVAKLQDKENPLLEQLQRLAENLKQEPTDASFKGKIFVQTGNKLQAIDSKEIIWLQAEKDYTWLITAQKKYLSTYGLGQLEQKLDKSSFLRVHRSSIINLNCIKEIEKQLSSYDIIMENKDVVRVSRSYMEDIKKRLL